MHTDPTLAQLEHTTTVLGQLLRKFTTTTCAIFTTKELPREQAARGRRNAATAAKSNAKGKGKEKDLTAKNTGDKKTKTLNLSTFKLHSLADYPNTIRRYGTTDSYSTQIVECSFVSKYLFTESYLGRIRTPARQAILHTYQQG